MNSSNTRIADAQIPGIRAEVRELKRSSNGILTLRFAIVNDMDQKYGGDRCAFRETGNSARPGRSCRIRSWTDPMTPKIARRIDAWRSL